VTISVLRLIQTVLHIDDHVLISSYQYQNNNDLLSVNNDKRRQSKSSGISNSMDDSEEKKNTLQNHIKILIAKSKMIFLSVIPNEIP
jgi:hypothetical protein